MCFRSVAMAEVSINSEFLRKVSDGFFRGAEVMEGCCSIKWKNVLFHHLSTFYKTMAYSLRFSTGFGTPPDFYVLLLIASINLESLDRDWCNCQAQCHPESPCRYIFCVYLHCRYIFRIYFQESRLRRPVSIVFADSLVSSKLLHKRVRAKRMSQKKRNVLFPTCFSLFVKRFPDFSRFAPSGATISCL